MYYILFIVNSYIVLHYARHGGSKWVGSITALERKLRQQEERNDPGPGPVDDIWSEADVCWGSLVGASVNSGYLVRISVS